MLFIGSFIMEKQTGWAFGKISPTLPTLGLTHSLQQTNILIA